MGSISAANAEFCFDVFKELRVHHANDNIFYCPLSMMAALAMVYLGARGNTEYQMEKVLHFDKIAGLGSSTPSFCGKSVNIHFLFKEILSDITAPKANYSLHIANRLYAEKTSAILPIYVKCVKKLYRAGLEMVNFKTASNQARQRINSWVKNQTNGRIQDLLEPGSVDLHTVLVLVNAIYFKGIWKSAFNEEETREVPFSVTKDLFSPSANLSGISSAESLKISEAVHEAYMEVTEEGTEVTGSTVVTGDTQASSEFEEFRADHPFLFLIKHNPSNMILFFGRYCSP
ncbi:PREDICTED: ovalbumin-related protein Y-like [Lepidothrix coronata]|uniref:Ovalbumin-related protein Y-like n=1 Tax=Lepidothrix coronata TaxID=321398 RepID=A0A6J0IDR2_9PASS|nr:PREDICTED: ovalbumin-related protein Y-like [Lepidothrix coronata]